MQKSYIPKATEEEFCEGFNLCTVRRTEDGISKIGIKKLDGTLSEEQLDRVINSDTYNGKNIVRVYSSGHVFLSENKKEIFLITTEKEGKIQHQFTGGSPQEDENKKVVFQENGIYKFNLKKVRENARLRTSIRVGIKIIEEYNGKPLVDWVLMECEESGKIYYKLICLMHFVVKQYEGTLGYTGKENTTGGKWYNIDNLLNEKNIALNAYIVSKEAIKIFT